MFTTNSRNCTPKRSLGVLKAVYDTRDHIFSHANRVLIGRRENKDDCREQGTEPQDKARMLGHSLDIANELSHGAMIAARRSALRCTLGFLSLRDNCVLQQPLDCGVKRHVKRCQLRTVASIGVSAGSQ